MHGFLESEVGPLTAICKVCSQIPSGENLGDGHLVPSVLSPGGNWWGLACLKITAALLLSIRLWAQTLMAIRAGVLGDLSLEQYLKGWGARCVVQTLHSSGRSWESGVPPSCRALCWGVRFIMKAFFSLPIRLWDLRAFLKPQFVYMEKFSMCFLIFSSFSAWDSIWICCLYVLML